MNKSQLTCRLLRSLRYLLPYTLIFATIIASTQVLAAEQIPLGECISGAEREVRKREPSAVNLASLSLNDTRGRPAEVRDGIRNAKNVFLVYNLQGDVCFQNYRRVKEGDLLHVGVYAHQKELETTNRLVLQCESESSEIRLLDTLNIGAFNPEPPKPNARQSNNPKGTVWFTPQECFGNAVRFELREKSTTGGALTFGKTINQYQRFRGTFQIGTVWTELSDRQYSRVTINGSETIQSETARGRGPEFVGSLVIYGLPHYLASIGNNQAQYSGRDIVNENGWMDSLGLVLSVGLDDPTKTLGVGLSYEIVSGVSLTLSHLSREISVLNGLSVGATYPTASGAIPLQDKWDSETVIGLSIDGRYLTKFFGN